MADLRRKFCDAHLLHGEGWVRELVREAVAYGYYGGVIWQGKADAPGMIVTSLEQTPDEKAA